VSHRYHQQLKMAEKKKYNYMENVLINITSKFISLPDKEVKRNNRILESVSVSWSSTSPSSRS
jgi:hypothetical protein